MQPQVSLDGSGGRFDTGEKGNGGRDLSEVAKCQGMQAATRGGRTEQRSVLWNLKRGHSPAHTLVLGHSISDFWPLERGEKTFLLVKPSSL